MILPISTYKSPHIDKYMSHNVRKPTMWILTRSDTNQAVQPLEIARSLKICIKEVEVLYYPSSENRGADQLRSYREADLCLCFCICKTLVFSRRGSYEHLQQCVLRRNKHWGPRIIINYSPSMFHFFESMSSPSILKCLYFEHLKVCQNHQNN